MDKNEDELKSSRKSSRKETMKILMDHHRHSSEETLYESDGMSVLPESNSDLELDINSAFLNNVSSLESFKIRPSTRSKMQKLSTVKLDSISIPSTQAIPQPIYLNQSFNFTASFKSSEEISTQTSQVDLRHQRMLLVHETPSQRLIKRSTSLPPENKALTNLEKRTQVVFLPKKAEIIGDGKNTNSDIDHEKKDPKQQGMFDLEVADRIPILSKIPVQRVIIKTKGPRKPTPKYTCKKFQRPVTKQTQKRPVVSFGNDSMTSTTSDEPTSRPKATGTKPKVTIVDNRELLYKPENLRNFDFSSDLSTDGGLDIGCGTYHTKLTNVIDKLQDNEWETCVDGLRDFLKFAGNINWDADLGQRFIPIISRKLVDFFKSPRSNLCRTACQTAGEFFNVAKSTKRPEYDEMVDILLCKTADPNRFIQKDAIVALDKMATSICLHHSVRAICSKGPEHKNPVVRASTARLLFIICKHQGVENIVGSDANARTRKRVLTNLAKFLMDKNLETRRHAEKLCILLKPHKFFVDYFFKDIDNNFKCPLRKILNSLDTK